MSVRLRTKWFWVGVQLQSIVDERLEKITDLDKKVNSDDLICRYKGRLADTKFDEFDNALGIINKIQDGKKDLGGVKKKSRKI